VSKVDKAPYMPFYGNDFYGNERVKLASLAVRGLYVQLLWHEWAEGSIPSDAKHIALLVGRPEKDVMRLWEYVREFFVDRGDGRLVNEKLEGVRKQMTELRQKRVNARNKAGYKTLTNPSTKTVSSLDTDIETESDSSDSSISIIDAWVARIGRDALNEIFLRYPDKPDAYIAKVVESTEKEQKNRRPALALVGAEPVDDSMSALRKAVNRFLESDPRPLDATKREPWKARFLAAFGFAPDDFANLTDEQVESWAVASGVTQ
jgi:uncharacterized protein YdaU (DUF1376 family)